MTRVTKPDQRVAYTVAEVAGLLGVSIQTVHRMIENDVVGCIRVGRVVRIPVAEVDRILAEATPTAGAAS